jgi:hypothetical protein
MCESPSANRLTTALKLTIKTSEEIKKRERAFTQVVTKPNQREIATIALDAPRKKTTPPGTIISAKASSTARAIHMKGSVIVVMA